MLKYIRSTPFTWLVILLKKRNSVLDPYCGFTVWKRILLKTFKRINNIHTTLISQHRIPTNSSSDGATSFCFTFFLCNETYLQSKSIYSCVGPETTKLILFTIKMIKIANFVIIWTRNDLFHILSAMEKTALVSDKICSELFTNKLSLENVQFVNYTFRKLFSTVFYYQII